MEIDGVVYLKIIDPYKANYVVSHAVDSMLVLAQTTVRSKIGELTLDQTFKNREELNAHVVEALRRVGHEWGIVVMRYEVKVAGARAFSPTDDTWALLTRRLCKGTHPATQQPPHAPAGHRPAGLDHQRDEGGGGGGAEEACRRPRERSLPAGRHQQGRGGESPSRPRV